MSKYVLLMLVVFGLNLSISAQGQGQKSKKGNQKEAMDRLVSELDLDDLQEASLENILRQTLQERRSLREQELSQTEKRESLQTISLKENEEVAKILTEDQYNEFLSLKKEMREKAKKQRQGNGKKRN